MIEHGQIILRETGGTSAAMKVTSRPIARLDEDGRLREMTLQEADSKSTMSGLADTMFEGLAELDVHFVDFYTAPDPE
jgi:hypothetical protein